MRRLSEFAATKIHPGSWWALGLSIAILAGQSTNLWFVVSLIGICVGLILVFRSTAPWARSLPFYLLLASIFVLTRIVFRAIFNGDPNASDVALTLPQLNLPLGLGQQLSLFGSISWSTLSAATLDGLRLAAIILAVAMANTLSNPRRLLKSTPAALYEVAAAISVAINLAPQLIDSLQRVRRAKGLRGRNSGSSALTSIIIPALEDTLDRSLQLAASMDARGFGRTNQLSMRRQWTNRLVSLSSAIGLAIGAYLLVTASSPTLPVLVLTLSLAGMILVIRLTSKRNLKTRFNRQKFGSADLAIFSVCLMSFGLVMLWPNQMVGF
jgi:energy-coupling factor transport system permease protein